ncbi:MAG: hypothetical protein ACXWLD_05985 [Rhizomicrobium sp.]|jgi:hypothetical protein
MANPTEIRDSARRKANTHFTASEQRDAMVKKELEQERHAFDTRTAKLKALRLAKEAADAEAAQKLAASQPPKPVKKKKAAAIKLR